MVNYIANAKGHFMTIMKHKKLVFIHCVKAGIPYQGLVHDLSKFHPVEFMAGVKYYQGDHSPNVEQRRENGYSAAWLHHKGRNRHHFEYWFDNSTKAFELAPVKMPLKYVKEMFCDSVAASKVYLGDKYTDASALTYFNFGRTHTSHKNYERMMHPETEKQYRKMLQMLAEKGEEETFRYIRNLKEYEF